jgi:hypothetical protein
MVFINLVQFRIVPQQAIFFRSATAHEKRNDPDFVALVSSVHSAARSRQNHWSESSLSFPSLFGSPRVRSSVNRCLLARGSEREVLRPLGRLFSGGPLN